MDDEAENAEGAEEKYGTAKAAINTKVAIPMAGKYEDNDEDEATSRFCLTRADFC